VYRIFDSDGKPIGVPIKASDFYNKPTLKFLEQKFMSAGNGDVSMKNRIKNAVDLTLLNKSISFFELGKLLEKEMENYKEIPPVRKLDNAMIQRNYLQIKQDVQDIIHSEMNLYLMKIVKNMLLLF
jgi:hypothetical protein